MEAVEHCLSRKPTGRLVRADRASDRHPNARSDARSNAWVRDECLDVQTVRRIGRWIGRSERASNERESRSDSVDRDRDIVCVHGRLYDFGSFAAFMSASVVLASPDGQLRRRAR